MEAGMPCGGQRQQIWVLVDRDVMQERRLL